MKMQHEETSENAVVQVVRGYREDADGESSCIVVDSGANVARFPIKRAEKRSGVMQSLGESHNFVCHLLGHVQEMVL